jgi:hypothetical protein
MFAPEEPAIRRTLEEARWRLGFHIIIINLSYDLNVLKDIVKVRLANKQASKQGYSYLLACLLVSRAGNLLVTCLLA